MISQKLCVCDWFVKRCCAVWLLIAVLSGSDTGSDTSSDTGTTRCDSTSYPICSRKNFVVVPVFEVPADKVSIVRLFLSYNLIEKVTVYFTVT